MKYSKVIMLGLVLMISNLGLGQSRQTTRRAASTWPAFYATVRAAIKKRDRDALMKTMPKDFYYLSSGGDENDNGDTRDEAFEYWTNANPGAWTALEKALAAGTVPNVAMREYGSRNPSRVAPPQANNKRAIANRSFEWYAVFEFKNNRWYFTGFTECCE
jgi:hypothetical protein